MTSINFHCFATAKSNQVKHFPQNHVVTVPFLIALGTRLVTIDLHLATLLKQDPTVGIKGSNEKL